MQRRLGYLATATLLLVACDAPTEELRFGGRSLQLEATSYDLDIEVDYQSLQVRGTGRITVGNVSETPADHVPLLLYRLMRADRVADSTGNPLRYSQRVLAFEDWDILQANYVEVELDAPVAPGGEQTLLVDWTGYLFGYPEAMLYVQENIDREFTILRPDASAYPKIGYPSDSVNDLAGLGEFDYTIRVTVPDELVVANGGELVRVTRNDGKVLYEYSNIKPAWRIDIAIAPYEILERAGLKVFYFPGDESGAARVASAFGRATATFTGWFGALPDSRGFTVIEIPSGFGSQADVTSILQEAEAFRDPARMYELYHEASHLWNVDPTDPPSPRWNEGLAVFLQWLLVDLYAADESPSELEREARQVSVGLTQIFSEEPHSAQIAPIDYGREGVTWLSYRVGMLMFGVLYELVGPEDFHRTIGGFFQDHHRTGASTDQFVAYAKQVADLDLGPFFQDWMYSTGYVRFLESGASLREIAESYR